jgi:hypothetical protein
MATNASIFTPNSTKKYNYFSFEWIGRLTTYVK